MDATRYARIRELFLAAEELPSTDHVAFLELQVGEDKELINDVLALLAEHNAESARLEGERAAPIQPAMLSQAHCGR